MRGNSCLKHTKMHLAVLTLHLMLPGCTSLKQKRGLLRPILTRLHHEFNLTIAEVDLLDVWREAVIVCAVVSNNSVHNQQVLQKVIRFTELHWPDFYIADQHIELIT